MERYIKQLIEEMDEAISRNIDLPRIENQMEFEDFPDVEEIDGMAQKSIASWLDRETKLFPPRDFLTLEQMELISQTMIKAFEKINVFVELPGRISQAEKYSLLLELWDEPFPFLTLGSYHADFCSGNCGDCRIRKYCEASQEGK